MEIEKAKLAKMIDHTLLKAEAEPNDIIKLCNEANLYHFASVCVNSSYVPMCVDRLKDSDVNTCAVVGFPLGAMVTEAKAFEAKWCVDAGAKEVDMVLEIGRLKAGDLQYVKADIAAVIAVVQGKAIVKVILETCLLTDAEKKNACVLAQEAGAAFVKTSTGFSKAGATVEDVKLMRSIVGPNIGVKAAGGIHTRADAIKLIEAGATRIGASASLAIING